VTKGNLLFSKEVQAGSNFGQLAAVRRKWRAIETAVRGSNALVTQVCMYVSTSCLVVLQGLDVQQEGTSALGRLKCCTTDANLIELRSLCYGE
jgi:hypothetical protein